MSYTPTTWQDRVVEKPNTFDVTENEDKTITLAPHPGIVSQGGTAVNANAMNHIEQGIKDLDTNKVNTSDIVDDLTHTDTNKPLSANQGKVLGLQLADIPNQDYIKNKALQSDLTTTNTNLNTTNSNLAALQTKVNAFNGSPKFVTLANQMTDTTKNYVYLGTESGYTANHLYWYNGTSWQDAGVYQAQGIGTGAVKLENMGYSQNDILYIFNSGEAKPVSIIVNTALKTVTFPIGFYFSNGSYISVTSPITMTYSGTGTFSFFLNLNGSISIKDKNDTSISDYFIMSLYIDSNNLYTINSVMPNNFFKINNTDFNWSVKDFPNYALGIQQSISAYKNDGIQIDTQSKTITTPNRIMFYNDGYYLPTAQTISYNGYENGWFALFQNKNTFQLSVSNNLDAFRQGTVGRNEVVFLGIIYGKDIYTYMPKYQFYFDGKPYYQRLNNVIYVDVKNGDYNNIQEAIDNCNDSVNNPVTIMVGVGTWDRFSMTDAENKLRYISIIGVNKHDCIIADHTGAYATPPAEVRTNGIISHLTFMADHAADTALAHKTEYEYAMHMDFGTQDVTIEDCIFISYQAPAVGIGLHQDEHIKLKHCVCLSYADTSYGIGTYNDNGLGALYCHTNCSDGVTNQNLWVEDCIVISFYLKNMAQFDIISNTPNSTQSMTLIKNMFFSHHQTPVFFTSGGSMLSKYSFGNNRSEANYTA